MHHVVATPEEPGSLREAPDMIVKHIQNRRHLGKDERLRVSQYGDCCLIYHVEAQPLLDRALSGHLFAP